MRRVGSIILFVLAGWLLATPGAIALFGGDEPVGAQLGLLLFTVAFALPFLLLGAWASPGRKAEEMGLTLMIATGVSLFMGLMMVMLFNDPGFRALMPPDQPMPEGKFSPILAIGDLILIGGSGFGLWRWGKGRRAGGTDGDGRSAR